MSFGFSVGDFKAIYDLVSKTRKEFVNAPAQFKDISNEVRSLSIVLQDVEVILAEQGLTDQQTTQVKEIVEGCQRVLEKLNEILGKHQELDQSPKSFGGKTRKVWKRLKWEPEDIYEIRSCLITNIGLLTSFQTNLANQFALATRDGVDQLNRSQTDQKRQAIVDWLTPIDYSTQQSDHKTRYLEGTGQWLLDANEFRVWLNQPKQTLFCPGIPGAGKTILTSLVVQYLWNRFETDATIGIAYLYCNFRRKQEQHSLDLLTNILKQLVQDQQALPKSITTLYEHSNKSSRTRPSFDEISRILHSVVADYSKTFIVIDALDECGVSDGTRRKILDEIFNLQSKANVSFFATSRFIPEIVDMFDGSPSLEIRASKEDVQRYIVEHMPQLPPCVRRSCALQEDITTAIVDAVDGMFLLAQLFLESLGDKLSEKKIRHALENLPKGTDALDKAYQDAMDRIHDQRPGFRAVALSVLSWITCATRPLTSIELRHALAVESCDLDLREDNLLEIGLGEAVSVCAGLVTVEEESNIVRLVHYTTQEYFERTQSLWFPKAHFDIATVLVTYLSFDRFETGICLTSGECAARLKDNPLYEYACEFWGFHARRSESQVELVQDFICNDANVAAACQPMRMYEYELNPKHHPITMSEPSTSLHLTAYFDLLDTARYLIGLGHDPDRTDILGQTPLYVAASRGSEAFVRLLLTELDINPNTGGLGSTPLAIAASNRHQKVVKVFLATPDVDPDATGYRNRTPLSLAAERGYEEIVQLLLNHRGVDPDYKNSEGQTPLFLAAQNGHEDVIKLLLSQPDVEPNPKDMFGETPLSLAAKDGQDLLVMLLLSFPAIDPDSQDIRGSTPLLCAALEGHVAVMQLLLARPEVDVNHKDTTYGRTPLCWAARAGRTAAVELLLEHPDIELASEDYDGYTALDLAETYRHDEVVVDLWPSFSPLYLRTLFDDLSI